MEVLADLKAYIEENEIGQAVDSSASATTDASHSYSTLVEHKIVAKHDSYVMKDKRLVGKVLP